MACNTPYFVKNPNFPLYSKSRYIPGSCGRCPHCRNKRVNSWAFRLFQEAKTTDRAHFLTLTYNPENVPVTDNGFMTLRKSDLQKFWKRLRHLNKHTNEKIRYYACGEYGTNSHRPHYHALVFGADEGTYDQAWSVDGNILGNTYIGTLTDASSKYTLKYISKPGKIPMFANDDRVPEFSVFSRGLGANYITDETTRFHVERPDKQYITIEDGIKIAMPDYYRRRIFSDEQRKEIARHVEDTVVQEYDDDLRKYLELNRNKDERDFMRERFESMKQFLENFNKKDLENRNKI